MKIEHIAIWVRDLEGMKNFYANYFGARASNEYHNPNKAFSSYFLSFADGPRMELMYNPVIAEKPNDGEVRMGLIHFAISVGSRKRVDDITELLRQSGYTIQGEPRTTGDGYYESVVLDPEENRIEITV